MKQTLTNNRHLQIAAALVLADICVFTMVNPRQASAPWLIGGFLLLGLSVFAIAGLVAASLKSYGNRAHKLGKRASRYAAVAVVALVGLQSIGQLTLKDVVTLLPLVVGAYLYISYGKRISSP